MGRKNQVHSYSFVYVLATLFIAKLNQICDLLTICCSWMKTQKGIFNSLSIAMLCFPAKSGITLLLESHFLADSNTQLVTPFLLCNQFHCSVHRNLSPRHLPSLYALIISLICAFVRDAKISMITPSLVPTPYNRKHSGEIKVEKGIQSRRVIYCWRSTVKGGAGWQQSVRLCAEL